MKKTKIISMDFDGTLLTSDKKISDRTRKCLIKLKKPILYYNWNYS